MNFPPFRKFFFCRNVAVVAVICGITLCSGASIAQTTAFRQAVAENAAADETIAAWYRSTGYKGLWTGADDAERRNALFTVLASAGDHGLPTAKYDSAALRLAYFDVRNEGDVGRLEVMMTKAFLHYAHDVHSGVLTPAKIDPGIVRDVPLIDPNISLAAINTSDPLAYLRSLPPTGSAYALLMKEKINLQRQILTQGWGETVSANSVKPGTSGPAVVQLRNRLVALGYLPLSATQTYDAKIEAAVQEFQVNTGLEATGIASESTIAQINVSPEDRLKSVLVALERERWLNIDRGDRYVWVNLTDFSAKIIDHGKVTFATRSVIGKNVSDRRTPEFSDEIEFADSFPAAEQ